MGDNGLFGIHINELDNIKFYQIIVDINQKQ